MKNFLIQIKACVQLITKIVLLFLGLDAENESAKIYNMLGQEVKVVSFSKNKPSFSTEVLTIGVYILVLENGNKKGYKFMK